MFTKDVLAHSIMQIFKVMQIAGIDGEQVVFVVEDNHLTDPQFLEILNSLLSAGEVPGLYNPEEIDPLLNPLRDQASQDSHRGTMYSYFAKRKIFVHYSAGRGLKISTYRNKNKFAYHINHGLRK